MSVSSDLPTSIRSSTDLGTPQRYFSELWSLRRFLFNMVRLELISRFRRTKLGMLYLILLPLAYALMFAWVLSALMGQPFSEYVVYVFTGQVLWEFIAGTILLSSGTIVSAEGYMRVQRMPLIIFPLRTILTLFVSFFVACTGVIVLTAALQPDALSLTTPLAFVNVLFIFVCFLPWGIASAFFGLRYRDWQQLVGIVMQFVWFLSPVFLRREIFDRPDLAWWNYMNPIARCMELWRQPLLHGQQASLDAFLVLAVFGIAGYLIATWLTVSLERKALFYL